MVLGFHHQKVNVLVASGDAGQFKTYEFCKLGNLKRFPEILKVINKCTARKLQKVTF